jgi:hypothetical protein
MKKTLVELIFLFASILLMGLLGAIYSLVFAGVAGWISIGINPTFTFKWVERSICPPGSSIQYQVQPQAGSHTGPPANSVTCLGAGGTPQPELYDRAVFAVNRMFFLLCFIPTFIPGAILMRLSIHRWAQRVSDVSNEPDESENET